MSRVLAIFPFDSIVNFMYRFDLFAVLSKTFIEVAVVTFLGRFKSGLCVCDGFC